MYYVKSGYSIVDIDPATGLPRCYLEGEELPRLVQAHLNMGMVEEKEVIKKNKKQEA